MAGHLPIMALHRCRWDLHRYRWVWVFVALDLVDRAGCSWISASRARPDIVVGAWGTCCGYDSGQKRTSESMA